MLANSPWKNVLILAAAGVLVVGYGAAWFLPAQRELTRLRADLAEKQAYAGTARVIELQAAEVQRELDRTLAFCNAWKADTPAENDLSPLYARIDQSVAATGATVTRFEPLTVVPRERLRQVPVQMHTLGAFSQIAQALVAVEKVPGALWIDDLKITQPREAGQKTQCEAKLVIFAAGAEISE